MSARDCPRCQGALTVVRGARIYCLRCAESFRLHPIRWGDYKLVAAVALGLLLAWLLTGCQTRTVYVDRPGPERIVERLVYVGIPAALTAPLPIARGGLEQCPVVARDRRTQLELGNARFEAISKIQGQPVPPAP